MGMIQNLFNYELSIKTLSYSGRKIDDAIEIKRVKNTVKFIIL